MIPSLHAQERLVDDAAITNYRSFQIETWVGEHESVFMPAFGINSLLEIGTGLLFDTGENMAFDGWLLEAKVINTDYETAGHSWGAVTGFDLNEGGSLREFYAYIPYSRLILGGGSVLHLNAGISLADPNGDSDLHLIYGARGDFGILPGIDILAGLLGEDDRLGYYAGLRADLVADLLQVIGTYGRGFESAHRFPGPAIQLSFTPPPNLW